MCQLQHHMVYIHAANGVPDMRTILVWDRLPEQRGPEGGRS